MNAVTKFQTTDLCLDADRTLVAEWVGGISGVAGALLLAMNIDSSGWGWVAFGVSNAAWIVYALERKAYGLLFMQAGFTLTTAIGMVRWLL